MKRLIAAWSSMIERKTPRWRRRLVSLAKKPSTALSQEQEVGVKWKTKRGWRSSHVLTFGVFVRGVVVEDDVHDLADRHGGLDAVQKPDELPMAVALHAAADDLALEYVERGEERRRAVSFVIVRHGRAPAVLQGQPRLGPIERLNLRLLVDREHHGMRRRIDVEPGDVAQPGGELRVGGELEGTHPVGLQLVRPPDALHRGDADPGGL